ncbi:MAG: hypothetical protein AAGC64_00690 [Bacteroidota bacterium]
MILKSNGIKINKRLAKAMKTQEGGDYTYDDTKIITQHYLRLVAKTPKHLPSGMRSTFLSSGLSFAITAS